MQCCGLCHQLSYSGKSALTACTVPCALSSHCPSHHFPPLLSSSLPPSHPLLLVLPLPPSLHFLVLPLPSFLPSLSLFIYFYSLSVLTLLSFPFSLFLPQVFNGLGIRLYWHCTLLQTSDRLRWLPLGFHWVFSLLQWNWKCISGWHVPFLAKQTCFYFGNCCACLLQISDQSDSLNVIRWLDSANQITLLFSYSPLMVLVQKVTLVAFALHDGEPPDTATQL